MNELINFENIAIRRVLHNDEWYFSIINIIEVLTSSKDPNQYWKKLKSRDPEMIKGVQIVPLSLKEGKRKFLCANTEGVFRIIMSIPSSKAEPFKLWLAEQGKRTLDEINNPELLTERQITYYKLKGYPDEWIKERIQSIKTRRELTDEWQKRGIGENEEYSILTATIAKGTFGMTPSEHAKFKGLHKENLRDNMTGIELIFSALSEEITRQKAIELDAKGFHENHEAAQKGGEITGGLVKQAEAQGIKVISKDNFLHLKGADNTPISEKNSQDEE